MGLKEATAKVLSGLVAGELARFREVEATIHPLVLKLNLVDASPVGELAQFVEAKTTLPFLLKLHFLGFRAVR